MMYRKPMVPDNFQVPNEFITGNFYLKPLTMDDVDGDYDAVMQSMDDLGNWDVNTSLTKREDLRDLGWHEKEWQKRSSFAYTILLNDNRKKCVGCFYIYPGYNPGYDAEVYLWVTKEIYDQGLDPVLFKSLKKWLEDVWPFKKVWYGNREGKT